MKPLNYFHDAAVPLGARPCESHHHAPHTRHHAEFTERGYFDCAVDYLKFFLSAPWRPFAPRRLCDAFGQ